MQEMQQGAKQEIIQEKEQGTRQESMKEMRFGHFTVWDTTIPRSR